MFLIFVSWLIVDFHKSELICFPVLDDDAREVIANALDSNDLVFSIKVKDAEVIMCQLLLPSILVVLILFLAVIDLIQILLDFDINHLVVCADQNAVVNEVDHLLRSSCDHFTDHCLSELTEDRLIDFIALI